MSYRVTRLIIKTFTENTNCARGGEKLCKQELGQQRIVGQRRLYITLYINTSVSLDKSHTSVALWYKCTMNGTGKYVLLFDIYLTQNHFLKFLFCDSITFQEFKSLSNVSGTSDGGLYSSPLLLALLESVSPSLFSSQASSILGFRSFRICPFSM